MARREGSTRTTCSACTAEDAVVAIPGGRRGEVGKEQWVSEPRPTLELQLVAFVPLFDGPLGDAEVSRLFEGVLP